MYKQPLIKKKIIYINFRIDQDILNNFFYTNNDKLYVLPCYWNFRHGHCIYNLKCNPPNGIKLIHGAALTFTKEGFYGNAQQIIYNFYESIDKVCKRIQTKISIMILSFLVCTRYKSLWEYRVENWKNDDYQQNKMWWNISYLFKYVKRNIWEQTFC